jgi:hypothetical protein
MQIKYILFWQSMERGFATDESLLEFIRTLPHNAEVKITVVGKGGA